jgi:hypothetical protein
MENNKFFINEEIAGRSNSILINRHNNGLVSIKIADDETNWHSFSLDAKQVEALIDFLNNKGE